MENDTQQPQKTPQVTEISQEQSSQQKKQPKTKWLILLIAAVVIFGGYFAFAFISNLWPFSTQQQEPVDLSQLQIDIDKFAEVIKRPGGGPGGCTSLEECGLFCSVPENDKVCVNFFIENSLILKEEEQKTEQSTNLKSQLPETTSSTVVERLSELAWNETEALAVAEKVRASTICLGSRPDGCNGTGWVAAPQLVATCGHCLENIGVGETVYMRTITGAKMSAEVLEFSLIPDLGIIKVTSNLSSLPPPLPIGTASMGEPIIMVGHPGDVGTWVVTLGEVLSADSWGEGGYLADLPGRSGNSGSPVANRNGEVIGVFSGGTSQGDLPDPYPFVILLNLEEIAQGVATIESRTEMIDMIERHR